jgi:hypothetical protein
VGQAEEPEIQSENMELEPNLDSLLWYFDQLGDAIQHSCPMDISDTNFFMKMNPSCSRALFLTASPKK